MNLENPFSPDIKTPGMYKATELLSGKKKAEEYRNSHLASRNSKRLNTENLLDKGGSEGGFDFTDAEQASLKEQEWFDEIRIKESKALREFFGFHINVPPVPKEITPEKLKACEAMGFELHYLPKMTLDENAEYPGWEKKPDYKYLNKFNLQTDFLTLPGGWMLVDARPKPNSENGRQMYENDPFASALEKLRQDGVIANFKHPKSRFNLSLQELENPKVRQVLANALGIDVNNLSLLKYIEFNLMGNLHHPEWGQTDTSEWFADRYYGTRKCLYGGCSIFGGLVDVGGQDPLEHVERTGFRVLGRF